MAVMISEKQARGLGLSFGMRTSARTKYGNIPTFHNSPVIGEKKFDSRWEAELARLLDAMVAAGEIRTYLDQVRISLVGKTDAGQRRFMVVDFMIIDLFGRCHFWDAKAVPSAKWKLQRDLAWSLHQIDVKAVKKGAALPQLYEDEELDIIRSR